MKQITNEQIEEILKAIYITNISAQNFDIIKKFFNDLPEVKQDEPKTPKARG